MIQNLTAVDLTSGELGFYFLNFICFDQSCCWRQLFADKLDQPMRDGQNDSFPGISSVHFNYSFVTSDYVIWQGISQVSAPPARRPWAKFRRLLGSTPRENRQDILFCISKRPTNIYTTCLLSICHSCFLFIKIKMYFTFYSSLFRHYRTLMVINKKYELQFNFFVCS